MRFLLFFLSWGGLAFATDCRTLVSGINGQPLKFEMPGLQVASLVDSTYSTGATLFRFPGGAAASYDARGGSCASVETTLLDEGSYSNRVDGIVLAGGSTMGLAATDGVRRVLFDERKDHMGFDLIPSIPGAVVYDYSSRLAPGQSPWVYPDRELGERLMKNLSPDTFYIGRAGAGVSATVNKVGSRVWGGQGAASSTHPWEHLFAAVVLNAGGDIVKNGSSLSKNFPPIPQPPTPPQPGQNTTISIVVTDVILDRNQLKRLAQMVHTAMAARIHPFQTYFDGDILFVASTGRVALDPEKEMDLQTQASELMWQAIETSLTAANRAP